MDLKKRLDSIKKDMAKRINRAYKIASFQQALAYCGTLPEYVDVSCPEYGVFIYIFSRSTSSWKDRFNAFLDAVDKLDYVDLSEKRQESELYKKFVMTLRNGMEINILVYLSSDECEIEYEEVTYTDRRIKSVTCK